MNSVEVIQDKSIFIHIGCGPKRKDQTLPAFQSDYWQEVLFDIDESVAPDIIGTMPDMPSVETGSLDALFSIAPIFLRSHRRRLLSRFDSLDRLPI